MAEYIRIHPESPNPRHIKQVVELLKAGGVIVYPTDTVYGLGCDIYNPKAVQRVALIKGIKLEKSNFSFICPDLSNLSHFTKQISTSTYKVMKRNLPGPFTFILPASNEVPKVFKSKKKTVGIRIPDNNICIEIVKMLGNPIMTTSIKDENDIVENYTDPELIHEKYQKLIDATIDGGYGNIETSTVIDATDGDFEIIRQGIGVLEL